ncbi:hypothetical protein [Tahibacter sp.]|uniref:hypothetical protein n=1 Tax=Tahibacter sp. TaxID=2056211 RepID=UPI0028C3C745|nr:hypothetical protein [Tahibacter sp.]
MMTPEYDVDDDSDDDDETGDAHGIAATLIGKAGMAPDEALRIGRDLERQFKAAMEELGEAGRVAYARARREAAEMLGVDLDENDEVLPSDVAALNEAGPDDAESQVAVAPPVPGDWLLPRGKRRLH